MALSPSRPIVHPPRIQSGPRPDSELPQLRMDLHQLADATVSVPILALDSGRNAGQVDGYRDEWDR